MDSRKKSALVVTALTIGALTVVGGVALNVETQTTPRHTSPSDPSTPTSGKTSDTPSAPSKSPTPKKKSRNGWGPTTLPSKPPSSILVSPVPPADWVCPTTADGTQKCPEDPYCPGGEFCNGDVDSNWNNMYSGD